MDLLPFQIEASTKIARRYFEYAVNPLMVDRTVPVPFYQNLNSLTGSGKTLILADTISQIRKQLSAEPIVLWLSKGKVVVWQTYANLSSGKYSDLVADFTVKPLLDCAPSDIQRPQSGLLLVATVGKFNQKEKEGSGRKVFQLERDAADASLWDMLKKRRDSAGRRRPFIVVYDEAHNLSNQQTELILELEPDALIAASATTRIPEALGNTISRFRMDRKWKDEDFVVTVRSSDVVESGLIKQTIALGGYVTPMEIAIDDMLDKMEEVETAAAALGLPFVPKAVYVSNTNVVSGTGNVDLSTSPFDQRQARPIVIWRHLVERRGIDPTKIAVYCNLRFDPKSPPPATFNLFAGGDNDYDRFIEGNYQHIIFNLTLQEGWDDPACYFAYIDKEMGSSTQVTQVIGRVLRQPNAQHYPIPSLNTAHFFVRADEKSVFDNEIKEVRRKLAADSPEVSLTVFKGSKGASSRHMAQVKRNKTLPEISIHAEQAMSPIKATINSIHDYRSDVINTVGKGGRIQVLQAVGSQESEYQEWIEYEHSNKVTARWIFVREIQKCYPKAVNICDIEIPKLDALVEYSSGAADHIREAAQRVVSQYLAHSIIVCNSTNLLPVPSVPIDPENMIRFSNSVHEGYSGLNEFELEFAREIDKTKRVWMRNPSRGLFEIPLLSSGGTRNFNPDFVVWLDKDIVVIDTKGDHLIVADAGRKLFTIERIGQGADVLVRLVTKGEWNSQIEKTGEKGYTVWQLRNGKPHPIHMGDIGKAVQVCLSKKT